MDLYVQRQPEFQDSPGYTNHLEKQKQTKISEYRLHYLI